MDASIRLIVLLSNEQMDLNSNRDSNNLKKIGDWKVAVFLSTASTVASRVLINNEIIMESSDLLTSVVQDLYKTLKISRRSMLEMTRSMAVSLTVISTSSAKKMMWKTSDKLERTNAGIHFTMVANNNKMDS